MTELRDRLIELAAVADAAPTRDTAGQARGRCRRYQRRRRAGTAGLVAAGAVALLALAGVSWVRTADPVPADADAQHALPERVYEPSRWLPTTADAGPLGALAAVIGADQGSWTGADPGLVGVSATTGEYRFLDLPWAVLTAAWALSPDGRHVAYWTTGDTDRSPNLDSGPVTGVAVYDAVTGQVIRHPVETNHGLDPDVLAWAGRDRLIFGYGQYRGGVGDPLMDQSSAAFGPRFVWDFTAPPRRLPVADGTDLETAGPGYVLAWNDSASGPAVFTEIRLDTGDRIRVDLGEDASTSPVLDDTGTRVAVVAGLTSNPGVSGRNPNAVRAGPVGSSVPRIPRSSRTFDILGWVDAHHVAVHQRAGSDRAVTLRTAINLLDVRDGSKRRITSLPGLSAPQVATDLLGSPPRAAVAPPRPVDPRVLAGATVLTLSVTAVGIVSWRRRVRP